LILAWATSSKRKHLKVMVINVKILVVIVYHLIFYLFLHTDFLKCLTGGFSLQFQKLEKGILEVYSKLEVGNFRAYLVDGLVHTFTNKVYYYTTDPSSKTFTSPGVCINLSTWLNDLINNQRPDDSMCIADTANEIFCKKSVDPVFPSCNNQMTQIGNSGTSSTSV